MTKYLGFAKKDINALHVPMRHNKYTLRKKKITRKNKNKIEKKLT